MRGRRILLICHREHDSGRTYWLIPGGGREPGETEEQCVQREMREETNLDVVVERLLLDERTIPGARVYQRQKTYLCQAIDGEARPGIEPEPEAAANYGITAVRWVDIDDEAAWGALILDDPITGPLLRRIRAALT
ncbi:MAG: NUDIX hydrolase [Chloroflexi bacterium]|nr:NUDIX hydrolase [Chloroflexota bacterium]MBU1749771.1 NUDIX hydrolase [Chloroflexota bacterium]MBU1878750.1 NUDIX hydrolase [Chloroflexota bacterium]